MNKPKSWPFIPSGNPIRIVRGEGNYLYMKDGRSLLDAGGGAIVNSIGHGRVEVGEAMGRAAGNSGYVIPTWGTPERERLADRLSEKWLPENLTRIYFGSGGSDTIDAALRLARFHHVAKGDEKRHKVIARDISYHGACIFNMGISGHPGRKKGLEPWLPDTPFVPCPYPLRYKPTNELPDAGVAAAQALEDTIIREGPETVCAFIAEPINGSSGGAIMPPDSYWPLVGDICRKYGILLIIDEVMTGFGRTGKRFAVEHYDIRADILVAGKGLAGGYNALGGVYATEAIVEPLVGTSYGPMFYTFGGHPSACAAADTVLDIMERENLVERAAEMGPVFEDKLSKLRDHEHVAEVRGRGFLWGIEVVQNRETLECYEASANMTNRIVGAGLKDGAFFYPGGNSQVRDVICLGPALTTTEAEMDLMVTKLEAAIDSATKPRTS